MQCDEQHAVKSSKTGLLSDELFYEQVYRERVQKRDNFARVISTDN